MAIPSPAIPQPAEGELLIGAVGGYVMNFSAVCKPKDMTVSEQPRIHPGQWANSSSVEKRLLHLLPSHCTGSQTPENQSGGSEKVQWLAQRVGAALAVVKP